MSRRRALLPWLLVLAFVAVLAAWFFATHRRVERSVPMPPRGEASYNPLYALKLALRASGQRVQSRQRLQLERVALGGRDTVVVYSDPRAIAPDELEALFDFAADGGHVVLRLPPWQVGRGNAADVLAEWLPIRPDLLLPHCMDLHVPGEKAHVEFCGAARFRLAKDAETSAAWRTVDGRHVFARFPYGDGSVDLASSLDLLANDALRDGPHRLVARQWLAPNWGRGTFHLVYAADMPPLWRWLLAHGWMALLPALLALLAWLWMRAQRVGPVLPSPPESRRSLLEHVEASGEHFLRYGRLRLLHRAMRDAVLARLRRRDPLAAALEGDAQAALLAQRTGDGAAGIRATLDTRPPANAAEFRHRIARLIALRKRL